MRIAVDGRSMQGNRRGMGVYTHSLIEAMARRGSAGDVTVFYDETLSDPDPPVGAGVRGVTLANPGGMLYWEQVALPLAARRFDVLHAPANGCPVWAPCPVVVTLHDAIFMRRLREISEVLYLRQILGHLYRTKVYPVAARRARQVITVSEASKRDIVEVFGIPGDRITVTHEALPESFSRAEPDPPEKVRGKFGIEGAYLLAMGAYEKRKNIPLLFRVMEWLSSSRSTCPQLVLTGAENLWATRYAAEVKWRRIGHLVKFLPYASVAELKGLYRGAAALLWPSRREGFGLPLLEAMSCGTPVITSDIPCHREIARDAALFVHPDDELGWRNAVARIMTDRVLRCSLREKGETRHREFSWDEAARKTLEVYARAVRGKRGEGIEGLKG